MPSPFTLTIDGTDYFAAFSGGTAGTPYVIPETIILSAEADGGGAALSFAVEQEVTPAGTPWFRSITDNAVVKFTDTSLTNGVLFAGYITSIDSAINQGGQGTTSVVTCGDPNTLLDKIVVYKGKGTLAGVSGATTSTIKLKSGQTDKALITTLLGVVDAKWSATTGTALFDASSVASVTSTATINEPVDIPLGTLRAALDTIVEFAQATDGTARRYYIDTATRQLVYNKAPAASIYATAPFQIVTTAPDNPTGGTATASTLLVRDLRTSSDHDQIRKTVVIQAADSNADRDTNTDPYLRNYNDVTVGFATRSGLTTYDILQAATITKRARTTALTNTAKAYFTERRLPMESITFSVRGAGTATGQTYGYGSGTAQTGAATYATVDRWAPGQQASITATQLGLSGLYRIESVTMGFEQGSLIRRWDITCNRRKQGAASQLLLKA
jgi:hypothetical protein